MIVSALIIFQHEFNQRNFFDWLVSHVSGSLPPHRYKGEVELSVGFIKFTGIDTKLNIETEFVILKESIEEVYMGYDEIFNVFQTRGPGFGWAPVRIKFIDHNEQEKVAYFITFYNRWHTANKDFYNFLNKWLS